MGIFSFLDPSSGYGAAEQQLQKYYGQGQAALSPYATAGNNMLKMLMSGASSLMNPEAMESQWINSYQESPYAKQLSNVTAQNGMTDASAMGLGGSSSALDAVTQSTGNIVNQDRQSFLNDLMQKYMTGLNVARGVYGAGANAAGEEGQMSTQMGNNMANMAYGKGSAGSSMFYGLLGKLIGSQSGGGGGSMAPVYNAISGAGGG